MKRVDYKKSLFDSYSMRTLAIFLLISMGLIISFIAIILLEFLIHII